VPGARDRVGSHAVCEKKLNVWQLNMQLYQNVVYTKVHYQHPSTNRVLNFDEINCDSVTLKGLRESHKIS
jgi:hypothetical protein